MGLLDDAIREHLDLKRHRGSDPSEIARLEREALGPVRREPFEPANHKAASDAEARDRSVALELPSEPSEAEEGEHYAPEDYDQPEPDEWGEAFDEEFERPGSRRSATGRTEAASDQPTIEPPKHEAQRRRLWWRRSPRGGVPPEDAPPTQAEPPADATRGEEAAEYGGDDAPGAGGDKTGDAPTADVPSHDDADVPEETSELLPDASEHDRLRSEQRRPRDFDFDD